MQKDLWLSAYIYYKDTPEPLLRELFPLVQEVMEKKWADQYFFIRYSDSKGRHIRLRFKGKEQILQTKVKPLLEKTFAKVRFVRYAPEYKRYGGIKGIELSEKLFAASSKAILEYLNESDDASYQRSLGMALQINLSMAHSFGMDRKEAIAFFDHLAKNDHDQYAKHLAQQNDSVLPFLRNLWEALEQKVDISTQWFVDWQTEIKQIAAALKKAYDAKELQHVDPSHAHSQNPLWYIYESYVHMNNNRLGIIRDDEGFEAYIIAKGLEQK